MIPDMLIFLLACLALVKSSGHAVTSISHLARYFRLTEFVTAFIVVAIVSALPETFIALISAFRGEPALGLGTLLGGNIADLTLILGLVALAGRKTLHIHSSIVRKDLFFCLLTLLPILLALDGKIGRIDAATLLIGGTVFLLVLLSERASFHKPYQNGNQALKQFALFTASITIMLASAHFIVTSAEALALAIGIPELIIGLILVALGTTLPEFTFSLQSIRKGHDSLALGDLLGVVVVDATLVTGFIALITPIAVEKSLVALIGVFTAFATVFALIFMRTDETITKNEGLALVLFYIAFVIVQVFIT